MCRQMKFTAGKELGGGKKNETIVKHLLQFISGECKNSDSERLEQPLLTSFVQAGNINSSYINWIKI